MSDNFYRAFEDRFRGSRESVLERLKIYQPFLASLAAVFPNGSALDLGCGRGEWLELLRGIGLDALGVDQDEGMLTACRERGLAVVQEDALSFLKNLPSNSMALVSAFHVVEHLRFEDLRQLVSEALRVLQSGGLLILETPNAENLWVASVDFYLDPTHTHPIPPQLLAFLCEYAGFFRIKTLRLYENPTILSKEDITIRDLIRGVSPDYAVLCQKDSGASVIDSFSEQEFGMSMEPLLDRFDYTLRNYKQMAMEAKNLVSQMATEVQMLRSQLSQVEPRLFILQENAASAVNNVQCLQNSKSWRMTVPLRWSADQFRRLRDEGIMARLKALKLKFASKYAANLAIAGNLRREESLSSDTVLQTQIKRPRIFDTVEYPQFMIEKGRAGVRSDEVYEDLKKALSVRQGEERANSD